MLAVLASSPLCAKEKKPIINNQDAHVEIKDGLTLKIKLAPDHGTRFIFPFVLDEENGEVPFNINVIGKYFQLAVENDAKSGNENSVKGKNFFILKYEFKWPEKPSEKKMLREEIAKNKYKFPKSNGFINIAGYHITLKIEATATTSDVINNIYFRFTEKKRKALIDERVEQRAAELERQYKKQKSELDLQAQQIALKMVGNLVINERSSENVFEKGQLDLATGDEIDMEIDEVTHLGMYHVVSFKLSYNGVLPTALLLQDMQLFGHNESQSKIQLNAAFNTKNKKLLVGEETSGIITTNDLGYQKYQKYTLTVLTNLGTLSVDYQ